jgi:hypothetical protein
VDETAARGTELAFGWGVKNVTILLASVAVLVWVGWTQTVWLRQAPLPPAAAPEVRQAADMPRVHVEHHIVTVPVTAADVRSPAPPVARPVRVLRPERYGMFARTKRAFFGDGKHRPEPFPKPR